MHTIGLIAAMTLERNPLLQQVKGWKQIRVGRYIGQRFPLAGWTCVLVTSGMGVRRAAEAARTLVEAASPQLIVSFGIAGAADTDLEIGDVMAVEAVCPLEEGGCGSVTPLDPWPAAACEAAVQALAGRGARLCVGTAITTGGSQVSEEALLGLKHPILEMETAGIARVAADFGVPLRSLRAISDGPTAPIPFDLGEIVDEDSNLRAGRFLRAVLRRPGVLLQSRYVMRNSRVAADNAAIALVAALSQPGFDPEEMDA